MELAFTVGGADAPAPAAEDQDGSGGRRCPPPVQLDLKLSWSDDAGKDYMESDVGAASSSESHQKPASSRCSDEEEGGTTRKKLRLSKEQSCYLEESFKEHPTLNPKQKLALAKELNLRPRQVEVWFQNRRARTKLKQTEVDCEYLKRCCETLTEENRRLQRELQDLRALKSPGHPFRLHAPAATLTMCPSCERVSHPAAEDNKGGSLGLPKSRFCPS